MNQHTLQGLDFSPANSWLQLLLPEHRPARPVVKKSAPPRQVKYTVDHPLVVKARELYQRHCYSYNEIARRVNVDPKTVSRWVKKGVLQ